MTDIGPAGIKANIIHYNAVIAERTQHLQEAIDQMNYWLDQIAQQLPAAEPTRCCETNSQGAFSDI